MHRHDVLRLASAAGDPAEELQGADSDWPGIAEGDNGAYAVYGGGEVTADSGRNTNYHAARPADVRSGDTARVWAHCLTDGENVDLLVIP